MVIKKLFWEKPSVQWDMWWRVCQGKKESDAELKEKIVRIGIETAKNMVVYQQVMERETLNNLVEQINVLNGVLPSQSPDDTWTIDQIKAYLDQENKDYTGVTLKADLLNMATE